MLLAYVSLGATTEFVTFFMAIRHMQNLWVLHVYNLIEFAVLSMLVAPWQKGRTFAKLLRWSILAYSGFWLISKFTFEPLSGQAEFTKAVTSAVMIAAAVGAVFAIRSAGASPLSRNFRVWAVAGVIVYFAGNMTLFLLLNVLTNFHVQEAIGVWVLHWSLTIATNICFALAFLCPVQHLSSGGSSL